VVVVSRRCPVFANKPSWSNYLLARDDYDLDPYPDGEKSETVQILAGKDDIVLVGEEVDEWHQAQSTLAEHELCSEGFTAVPLHIAHDLWDPEGEVE